MMARVFILALALMIAACGKDKPTPPASTPPDEADVVDIASILENRNLTGRMRALRLVEAGERLVHPLGFMFAAQTMDLALTADPQNNKAAFYKKMLAPMMELRGIIKRSEGLIARGAGGTTNTNHPAFARFMNRYLDDIRSQGLYDFLRDYAGTPDIGNEAELQSVLAQVRIKQKEFREHIKANKGHLLELNINVARATFGEIASECSIRQTSAGVYEMPPCRLMSNMRLRFDRADLEVLQHLVAGLEIYMILATSYSANGAITSESVRMREKWRAPGAHFDFLRNFRGFGDLLPDHALGEIQGMGADMFGGIKWAHRLQDRLCPGFGGNRSEHFRRSVCVPDADSRARPIETLFNMIELALNGTAQSYDIRSRVPNEGQRRNYLDAENSPVGTTVFTTTINPLAPAQRPVANIKSLFPTQFNECGDVTQREDNTFGGVFPGGDAAIALHYLNYKRPANWFLAPIEDPYACNAVRRSPR